MKETNVTGKLPFKVKVSFSVLNSIPNLQMLLQMYYLVYFYVNILGISGTAAGLIIMIARIWDFINDPIMGVLVEKTKHPSKCLLWMKRALVPIAIFMVLTFAAPQFSTVGKIIWAAITFVFLGMSQTVFSIPKDTLQPLLTDNREERARLNVYNRVVSVLLNMLIPTVTMPLVAMVQGFTVNYSFMIVATLYGIIYIVAGLLAIRGCKGYEHHDETEIAAKKQVKTKDMFAALLKNKNAMLIIGLQMVKMLFSSIATAVIVYFCTYNLGNANYQSLLSAIGSIAGYVSIIFLVMLFRKFGNAGTGLFGSVLSFTLYAIAIVVYLAKLPVIILIACAAVASFGTNLITAVVPQCLMDGVDYNEYTTGHKNTAVIMSAYSLGNTIGLTFGSTIAAFALDLIKFDPKAATQPARVLNTFFHLTVTSQLAISFIMGLIFIVLMKTERKLPEMRKELAQRKAAVAQKSVANI